MKTLPIILLVVLFISAVSYTSLPLFNNIGSNRPPPAAIPTIEPAAVSIIPIESSPSGNPQALMSALINYRPALLAVTASLFIKEGKISYDVAIGRTRNQTSTRPIPGMWC